MEQDTVKLLRECDAGVKMGIASIGDVLDHVTDEALYTQLTHCKTEHEQLQREIRELLADHRDEGKEPNPIAKGMSKIKTGMMLGVNDSDATIADVMTDGCDMGIKSLNRYLNQYKAADEVAKDIAKKLIQQEEQLGQQLRRYL